MRKRQTHDRGQKQLRIGVRVTEQGFELLDGSTLPKLRVGTVAEIFVTADAIQEGPAKNALLQERRVVLLEKGELVLLGMSRTMIENNSKGLIPASDVRLPGEYGYVEVELREPLFLRMRGDQEARLDDCHCWIPALKVEASSLNHAFTLASQTFETGRRSHSGNVFERGYALTPQNNWRSLADWRLGVLAQTFAKSEQPMNGG
ncbi:MAG: hypothetical protein ABSB60_10630 [Terracidiphilus sp.]|jgi:hypothetical protein